MDHKRTLISQSDIVLMCTESDGWYMSTHFHFCSLLQISSGTEHTRYQTSQYDGTHLWIKQCISKGFPHLRHSVKCTCSDDGAGAGDSGGSAHAGDSGGGDGVYISHLLRSTGSPPS